ncbi:MAG TPA: TonB-dependent receptor [Caulobacteraceae bacterium]|nr:TonB-dependent receptor [Caulobacteraceae bacterium]
MRLIALTTAALFASTASGAFAADEAGVTGESTDATEITEVVVTAQRRQERLQDVPISVSAIDSRVLERQGITGTADLPTVVPGLNMAKSSTVVQPYLRGIGTANLAPGSDPSVPIYIDGIYLASPAGFLFGFNNIERVEVLKGPQGTLFGRNSTGGLVQIITRDPTPEPSGRFSISYGNYNAVNASAYVSGGLGSVSGDIALIYNKQSEGWGRNFYIPAAGEPPVRPGFEREAGVIDEKGLRSKLLWNGEDTTAELSLMYMESEGNQGHYRHLLPTSQARVVTAPYGYTLPYSHGSQGEGFYDYNSDSPWWFKNSQYMGSVEVAHDADFATVKSISSYQTAKALYNVPSDSSPQISSATSFSNLVWNTFTQEFQVLSNESAGPDWLEWIGGVYYLRSKSGYDPLMTAVGDQLAINNLRYSYQTSESYAAYAQGTINFGASTRLTLGARYTHDAITAEQYIVGGNPAGSGTTLLGVVSAFVQPVTAEFEAVTWRAALDHHFTDDIMVYVSASRGFKAGSWNHGSLCSTTLPSCPTVAPPVDPEVVLAYEAGLRSDFFDRRLRLNISAFNYDYSDLQIQAVVGVPPVSLLTNAAEAKIYGAELETIFRVTPNFRVNLNLAALHTEYASFPGAIAFAPRTAAPYNNAQIVIDATGNELSRSPPLASTLGFDWVIPVGQGEVNLNGSWYHTERFFWEPENRLVEPGYDLFNAQVAWRPNDRLQLRLWGKNLSDTQYYTYQTTTTSGDQGQPAAPRTFGVALDYAF